MNPIDFSCPQDPLAIPPPPLIRSQADKIWGLLEGKGALNPLKKRNLSKEEVKGVSGFASKTNRRTKRRKALAPLVENNESPKRRKALVPLKEQKNNSSSSSMQDDTPVVKKSSWWKKVSNVGEEFLFHPQEVLTGLVKEGNPFAYSPDPTAFRKKVEDVEKKPIFKSKEPPKTPPRKERNLDHLVKTPPKGSYSLTSTPGRRHIRANLSPDTRKGIKEGSIFGVVYEFVKRKLTEDHPAVKIAGLPLQEKRYVGYSGNLPNRSYNHFYKVYQERTKKCSAVYKKVKKPISDIKTILTGKNFKISRSFYTDMAKVLTVSKSNPELGDLLKDVFTLRVIYRQTEENEENVEVIERQRDLRNLQSASCLRYNSKIPGTTGTLSRREFLRRWGKGIRPQGWQTNFPYKPNFLKKSGGRNVYQPSFYMPVECQKDGSLTVTFPSKIASFTGDVVYMWRTKKGECLIGVTVNPAVRLSAYLDETHPGLLEEARKGNVEFGVIGTVEELGFGGDRWMAEQFYIKQMNSKYNRNKGGGGGSAGFPIVELESDLEKERASVVVVSSSTVS